ncbi:glycoside hydrolase family 65 protein [Polymorphospora rubra]|uniref:Glycosyl hydrolase n=1 Tax=Polymorphospora rubra TaxID=338584 RepID=A0A810N7J5_9ACTN|nr:glycoside hydrolase family 65 protein [Polymorphospora rubra]BCJ68990.1 glycosyl hydrolase [Polymorphospora rubra]
MRARPRFPVEPWQVREPDLDPDWLAEAESTFALSNGHIGLRGNLDEGDPSGMPGTYLNSFHEEYDLDYPESGYAFPERGQTVVNAPNGKLVRLFVDDEPFDVRTGTLRHHQRILDLRAGTLCRTVEWVSPAGTAIRLRSTRLVSLTRPAVAAVDYEVTAVDRPVRLRIESDLLADEDMPRRADDPRAATTLTAPLTAVRHRAGRTGGLLLHRTRRSRLPVASVVDHAVTGPDGVTCATTARPDRVRTTVTADLSPGATVRIRKLLGYAWATTAAADAEPLDALCAEATAAVDDARAAGWDALVAEQRARLDDFWDVADVELEGDPEVQQAVRFDLFHVLQSGARAGVAPIPAKGLTGNGYDGHVLWDTESFVLPVLTYTCPEAVRGALRWRHANLPVARDRARELRLAGAAFPWRTIAGSECSGYWPAGTAALHINADIADAVLRYVGATGDEEFYRGPGLDLLVETARLWRYVGRYDDEGGFHLDGVTGPDEYTAVVDDNLFTNVMARRNLRAAADAADRHPDRAAELGVDRHETAAWRAAAAAMHLPYDDKRGVHQQAAGFTRLAEWDFAGTDADDYPLLLHFPYFELYRKQVVKQADVVLAMLCCGESFSPAEKARNFAYYEQRTVRDSSLSASSQAVLAAEVGHLELAHDYLAESALQDLRNLGDKTGDGLHVASLAGAWTALVMGFGGLRDHDGTLSFAPRLPSHLPALRFSVAWRGLRLRVAVTAGTDGTSAGSVTYRVDGGGPDASVDLCHHGEPLTVSAARPVTRPVPPPAGPGAEPPAPPGRAPTRRRDVLDHLLAADRGD